jgi:DNA-binding MarR family transcriptional regulator
MPAPRSLWFRRRDIARSVASMQARRGSLRLRLTQATLAVVDVLMGAGPDDQIWGLRLCEEANLGSGTVYPLLERLEKAGIVTVSGKTRALRTDRPAVFTS